MIQNIITEKLFFILKMSDYENLCNLIKTIEISTAYRNEKIGDYNISVYKSALQKFLRRNELEKGLGTLLILSSLSDKQNSKRIISNIVNRLIAMMSEEVNIHNVCLPIIMKNLYEEFTITLDFKCLYKMYKHLCQSDKCRIISDIKSYYNLPPYYINNDDKHKQMIKHEIEYNIIYSNIDSNKLLELIEKSLDNKSYDVFAYLSNYLRKNIKNINNVWKIVNKKSNKIIDSLHYFFKKMTHKEKPIYLYHAILIIIHLSNYNYELNNIDIDTKEFKNPFPFPEYVFDIHTGNSTSKTKFAIEGAFIVNESTEYKNDKLREYYIKYKQILDS